MCAYINLHLVCQDVEYHRLFLFFAAGKGKGSQEGQLSSLWSRSVGSVVV